MARRIDLTQDQIVKVLDAMHYICVYVDSEEFLRITCTLCDHNLFVGYEEEGTDGTRDYVLDNNDIGADTLFILAGEHCLPGPSGLSECDSMESIGVEIDTIASSASIDLDQNDL